MDEDLIQLLIYVVLALIGIIGSAYRNRMKRQQTSAKTRGPAVPRNLPADPEHDFPPELGPLAEWFDIPRPKEVHDETEMVESGPAVEEAGMNLDTADASAEYQGMAAESEGLSVEREGLIDVPAFEEGQSEIQKMIARYKALQKELDQGFILDDISRDEIVSVDEDGNTKAGKMVSEPFFDPKKAIIYSEILKRKEY